MPKLDLSIIVVSYNTKELLRLCVQSVRKFSNGFEYEIIVIDNSSSDGTLAWLSKLKNIKLISNTNNPGFAKANNQGIGIAHGKYILLLNSDTQLEENSLEKMILWMEERPKVGIASCKFKNPDGGKQATGGFFPTLPRVFLWATFLDDIPQIASIFGSYHPSPWWYKKLRYQDWVTGAFLMFRREVLKDVGGLDENIFMYGEDVEFCYRAKNAGWKVAYVPIASIFHIGHASGSSARAILGEYKGLLYFYKKHKSFAALLLVELFLKLGALLRIFLYLVRGDTKTAGVYAKAIAVI